MMAENGATSTTTSSSSSTFSTAISTPGKIRAIDSHSVHRICSGQVITQLSVAIKELVENAVDAGATTVDVRLKEFGTETIEVVDNGAGIASHNYEGLTAKYHTSKIQEFDDIFTVSSFGFRGEALSSLCEVAGSFTVLTRTASSSSSSSSATSSSPTLSTSASSSSSNSNVGARLEYDRLGRLIKTTPVARSVGTTVIVNELFKPLPVRHREFLKSARKQYAKALTVLQAYALTVPHVRLLVTHIVTGTLAGAIAKATAVRGGGSASGSGSGSGGSGGSGSTTSRDMKGRSIKASWDTGHTVRGGVGNNNKTQSEDTDANTYYAEDDHNNDADDTSGLQHISVGRHSVLATSGSGTLQDCVIEVFGTKFFNTLMPIGIEFPVPSSSGSSSSVTLADRQDGHQDDENEPSGGSSSGSSSSSGSRMQVLASPKKVGTSMLPLHQSGAPAAPAKTEQDEGISGFVSKAGTGVGRSNNEKQFMFLNGRPVEMPRITKAVNEVWRLFEMGHKPAFILNLRLQPGTFDVNVTPDKREVFLVGENRIIDALKQGLRTLWEPSRRTFMVAPMLNDVNSSSSAGPFSILTSLGLRNGVAEKAAEEESQQTINAEENEGPAVVVVAAAAAAASAGLAADVVAATSSSSCDDMEEEEKKSSKETIFQMQTLDKAACGIHESSNTVATKVIAVGREIRSNLSHEYKYIHNPIAGKDDEELEDLDEENNNTLLPAALASLTKRHRSQEITTIDDSSMKQLIACDRQLQQKLEGEMLEAHQVASMISTTNDSRMEKHQHNRKRMRAVISDDSENEDENTDIVSPSTGKSAEVGATIDAKGTDVNGLDSKTSVEQEEDIISNVLEGSETDDLIHDDEFYAKMLAPVIATKHEPTVDNDQDQRESMNWAAVRDLYTARRNNIIPASTSDTTAPTFSSFFDKYSEVDICSLSSSSSSKETLTSALFKTEVSSSDEISETSASSTTSESVEETLTRILNKQNFTQMSSCIVGQFNFGFMVAGTGSDLFILDQHACDEKHQYEMLRATTRIHEQRLLVPRTIDLTAAEELTILEHLDVFAANGFHFTVDENAPAGRRARLAAMPFSKNIQFGDEDIRELASMLAEGSVSNTISATPSSSSSSSTTSLPKTIVRLPKANSMFASRACRSAIMIGTPLKRDVMRRVIAKLSELEQPWNCPHGRPTLRHLVDTRSSAVHSARLVVPAGPSAHK